MSKVTDMLLESGLISSESLRQLNRWKMLPDDWEQKVNVRPISLEKDFANADEFTDNLRSAINVEDVSIREATLDDFEWEQPLTVFWGDRSYDLPAALDPMDRVAIDVRGLVVGDGPTAIQLGSKIPIVGYEPIYQGQTCVCLILNLGESQ